MKTKRLVDWYFTFKGIQHHKKKVTFNQEMLIDFIGKPWYDFFFDENGKFKHKNDKVIATARELGKTYVVVAVMIYLAINDPFANFVLTRKYGSAAGSFYEMFSQVLNDFQDKYQISFNIKFTKEKEVKGKIYYETIREFNLLKGSGKNALFSYGKTGDDKLAIFYNHNFDTTMNQIFFLRGADDADGSRGLSVNVGYVVLVLLEEYSQEVDKGKLDPEEQITRYASVNKSSNRYAIKMIQKHPELFPNGLRTPNLALANIWDPLHPYNVLLLKAIPEDEYRKFVSEDPENNYLMIREMDGVEFVRGTSLANLFLYPKGSESRAALVKEMKESILPGNDDYKKAEVAGFTFPGFIKTDNPVQAIIHAIMDAPEMDLEDFQKEYKITTAEYGTDPGLRDAWASTPVYLGEHDVQNKLYINDLFIVNNKERRRLKQDVIPNPMLKQLQMDFWKEDLLKLPPKIQSFLEVNMDMRATAIRDDFNYEIFARENINGQCVAIPSQESQGFGLEQRPDILITVIANTIFSPMAKQQILSALKTLEPYAEDKKQPHPRKGLIDIYDSLCYGIVKLRAFV